MPYPTCQHTKINGILCGSPALNRKVFCYFHQRLVGRHPAPQDIEPGKSIALDRIGDRLDLLMNISQVVSATATNQIDVKRGSTLLKGFEAAGRNLAMIERLAKVQQDLYRPGKTK